MKKVVTSLVVFTMLTGCAAKPDSSQSNEIDQLKEEIEEVKAENIELETENLELQKQLEELENLNTDTETRTIEAQEIENYPSSLYREDAVLLDAEGKEGVVQLYVNAEQDEDGDFAFDDGQDWMLVVTDGENTYPLFDDYVQLGTIDFIDTNFDGMPGLLIIQKAGGTTQLQKAIFQQEEKKFVLETIY